MTSAREHIECGLHSGIPACCIAWYLTGWRLLSLIDAVVGETEDFGDGVQMCTRGVTVSYANRWCPGRDYIPCPLCVVIGRKERLNRCTCDVDARMRS